MNEWTKLDTALPMERWLDRFKALSDETRVVLLAALLDDELSVGELSEVIQAPQPGVSRHLSALVSAGLVHARKQGTATFHRVVSDEPLLDGPFGKELRRVAAERKLPARVERVLTRRRQKSESFFDKVEDWDTLRTELFADAAGYASLLPLVPEGLVVADIGTGTGGMLPYLAEVASEIVAVDLSAEMLRRAKARAKHLGLQNVVFKQGELSSLPMEDASVDAAFAALVLHHAPKPLDALREMSRVVKPGGAVVLIDLVSHGHEWLREEQADLWMGFGKDEIASLCDKAGLSHFHHRVISRASVGNKSPLELFVASGKTSSNKINSRSHHNKKKGASAHVQ